VCFLFRAWKGRAVNSIYLINPRSGAPGYYSGESFAAFGFQPAVWLSDLALPTVAAMAPPDFGVTLCDEHIQPVDLGTPADFVGITGKINQEGRMIELAREFRRRGKVVLFGGPYASLSPDRLRGECDILVRGEIENLAPRLFADLRDGCWQPEYIGDKPDLRSSPIPRWDLYPNDRAVSGTVQTSRGCPFECEFCDVIQYLGRAQRHKPPAQVIAELDVLYRAGYRAVFLSDDNFTVYRARAKELLHALIDWNDARTQGCVAFSTQVSIDCARDPELLDLCAAAGLAFLFVGIETPNEASLRETKKRQNVGIDLIERVERIVAHGMVVSGGMMVGFDSDDPGIFERQFEFAMASPIPVFTATPVSAPMATPLYARMQSEGRLLPNRREAGAASPWITNIVPKRMTLEELNAGVRWLCNRLYTPANFGARLLRFIDCFQPPAPRPNAHGRPAAPLHSVDADRTLLAGRVLRYGAEASAMVDRVSRRLERKPAASPQVMALLFHYVQIRHMYDAAGLWDRELGAAQRPVFNRQPT
jgi:hypothetical protein